MAIKSNKRSADTRQKYPHHIEIIHQVSKELLDVQEEHEIYTILCRAISRILPDAYFVVSKLDPESKNFHVVESYGFDPFFKAIKKLVGKDPYALAFPFNELTEDQKQAFESRKIHYFQGGINEITNGKINKTISRGIEKLLDISVFFALSFSVDTKYYGGMSFFIPRSAGISGHIDEEVAKYLETLSNIASAILQKLRNQKEALQYEAEYKFAQEKFKELVNQINDIVWIANGDGSEIIDLNNSFEKIYGYSATEFNRDENFWLNIVFDEDKKIAEKSNSELLKEGNSEAEYRIVRADGEIRWLRDRKSIIYDSKGKAIQMGGKATDITEQKKLEERLHTVDFALEASPTAVGLADFKGTVFYANSAYVKLWGYKDKKEVIGKSVSDFASSKEHAQRVLETIKQGKSYIGEGESVRIDGTKFNNMISAAIVKSPEGKPICMMALFVDITESKKNESIIAEKNKQLEELISTKDKLFSIIAHDLKSPFNSILGLSDILVTDYDKLTDKERRHIINLFHSSSESAFNLLENLLDWARVQRGKILINKETLKIRALVNESIKPNLLRAINKQITVENNISEEVSILADRNTMKTVFGNIFSNATKYTANGGKIVFSAVQKDSFLEINIKDNGVGMNKDKLNNLFKVDLGQSTLGTENEKGTGLGLLVCKEFIAKNDGEIKVKSEPGKGSVFSLLVPAS